MFYLQIEIKRFFCNTQLGGIHLRAGKNTKEDTQSLTSCKLALSWLNFSFSEFKVEHNEINAERTIFFCEIRFPSKRNALTSHSWNVKYFT